MADNKIIIGRNKDEKPDKNEFLKKDDFYKIEKPPEEAVPINENIWGNDSDINKQMDEKYLAEKRMFVRIRFIQRIECNTILKNIAASPESLDTPIKFSIFDISMGGIGIVCDIELKVGLILSFSICLDQILYDIMCEVIYCIKKDENFRIGLKVIRNNKEFIKHFKLLIARVSLTEKYTRDTKY